MNILYDDHSRAHYRARWIVALALVGVLAVTARAEFQEGEDYITLSVPVETRDSSKIEVVEVFSYGCIHCYNLEPVVTGWRRTVADDVDFRRLPLASQRLMPLATAFFTAEALDVLDRVHMPLFAAIHDLGIDMSRPEYIRRLFVREAGVDEAAFQEVYDSFGVSSRVGQAAGQARNYRIRSTPSMVVNGRYLIEAGRSGFEGMLLVVDHLIDQERAARTAEAAETAAEE